MTTLNIADIRGGYGSVGLFRADVRKGRSGIHVATGKPGTTAVPDGGACLPSASVSC